MHLRKNTRQNERPENSAGMAIEFLLFSWLLSFEQAAIAKESDTKRK